MSKGGDEMSIHIDEVLDYLDRNLVCQRSEDMPSLMAVLHDVYAGNSSGSEAEITAFSQGVLTGMLLMTELNRLP